MNFDFNNSQPIYVQMAQILRSAIVSQELAPGSRLPSVRELAGMARANPNTVQKALQDLEREGLIHTERTNGKFVTSDLGRIQSFRHAIAQAQITSFMHQMKVLGLSLQEVEEYVQQEGEKIYGAD